MTHEHDPFAGAAWPKQQCPSEEVAARIHNICARNHRPARLVTVGTRITRSIALSGLLFGVLLAFGWQRHPPTRAIAWALIGALIWGILQAAVILVGFGRSSGKRLHRVWRWGMVLTISTAFLLYLTLTSDSILPLRHFLSDSKAIRHTLSCGIHALLFGAMAIALLFVVWRKSDPFSPRLSGAVSGLAGGLVGSVALEMVCPHFEAWHLWIGHGLTLVMLVAFGWYAGRRWLAP